MNNTTQCSTISSKYERPQEWIDALESLYSQFSSNPTQTQKLNILIKELGDCNVTYMGMHKDPTDQHERTKLRLMELEYLENIGVYKPILC